MRILVVEDEVLIGQMLSGSLEDAGHEVMGPAATLAEALALCEAGPPALALLDIDLRDGCSGVEVARALFKRWGVLSIFTSSQVVEARQAQDIALGCICKPYEAETVLCSVELAREVMAGEKPKDIPPGFEPFSVAT